MKVRKLEIKDAPLMLEWMHDTDITEHLAADFASKTIEDAESFITSAQDAAEDLHMAVVDDDDEYMGTVSLKRIDRKAGDAELGIAVRRCAMGKGFSWFGMKKIIELGLDELGLKKIYWCVSRDNVRACRFYDKHGFPEDTAIREEILARYGNDSSLKWYAVTR